MPTFNKAWLTDAAERVVSSFLEAVVALVIAGGVSTLDASTIHILLAAGLTAALATAKTILAGVKTGTVSPASLLPKAKKRPKDAGYSLIELLVVVILILILVGIVAKWH